ncbi:MAG: pilus assembly protein [Anaerolineae bacterium]|jgi:Flp pilus assembly pilin Flp|nr:pilus assembly protein [Anaerolineae bacterium]
MPLCRWQEGQGLVEYTFILVLIAIVVLVSLTLFGQVIGNVFYDIVQHML